MIQVAAGEAGIIPRSLDAGRLGELAALRRDIHRHPELAFEETRTAELVADKLRDWGIDVTRGVGGTGVVGQIVGHGGGSRAIGLRADMDALPIVEATGLAYASVREGVMHACGHDGHTAMLLGAARELAEARDFAGVVNLIFQPAEEGGRGARAMAADGLFRRFPCDAIYGLHNWPGLPTGHIAIRPGPVMANCDRWHVTFRGTGGHGGSNPHLATDVTVAAGQFLVGLHTIVARSVPANETAVVSVGSVQAGLPAAANVMPASLQVHGVARTFSDDVRGVIRARLAELARSMASGHGCSAETSWTSTCIAVVNAARESRLAQEAAADVVGPERVIGDMPPSTAGEDFAVLMQHVPGCMSFVGGGVDGEGRFAGLHTPLFDFNDDILPVGVAYWCSVVHRELAGRHDRRIGLP